MKRLLTLLTATLLAAGGALATPAAAAPCASGSFCVWQDANFSGRVFSSSGDDEWWESWIADTDSSWANHAISGPGIKDHVIVYEDAIQWPSDGGARTICLAPGQEVASNANANDRGDAHVWAMQC
ncbi:peptidase inhibitor family I36 protein [Streptomyces sp. NPDC021093]|uniref:peptidase inhibitor family I36 protein n=1 Tax=Streptomyces sp. NPDC021093 TaxID=3365112 RepID=UPI0037BDBC04